MTNDKHLLIVGIVFLLYAVSALSKGGLRAIIWTDTIQFLIMVSAMILMITHSVSLQGGFSSVMEDARQGGRLDLWE